MFSSSETSGGVSMKLHTTDHHTGISVIERIDDVKNMSLSKLIFLFPFPEGGKRFEAQTKASNNCKKFTSSDYQMT